MSPSLNVEFVMKKFIMIAGILIALVHMVVFVNKKRSSEEKLETKMVQNVAIQNFMMNPNPQTIDDLLPPELQTDPWVQSTVTRLNSEDTSYGLPDPIKISVI
jgi:hypothetical protein